MRSFLDRIAQIGIACLATLLAMANGAERADAAEIVATWKPQRLVFNYRSVGRNYTCAILEYKIKMILQRLGASEQLEMKRFACRDLAGHARFEVVMRSPIEASDENIREITQYDSEDELLARLHGAGLPSAAEIETFPAVWTTVSFRRLDLDSADCALVQQIRRQILPKMAVQVTKDIAGVDCSQELTGIAGPKLTVLALVPLDRQPSSVH